MEKLCISCILQQMQFMLSDGAELIFGYRKYDRVSELIVTLDFHHALLCIIRAVTHLGSKIKL